MIDDLQINASDTPVDETYTDIVAPMRKRLKVSGDMGMNFVHNPTGARALYELLGEMAAKLDTAIEWNLAYPQSDTSIVEDLTRLLIERDGGSHDQDCKIHRDTVRQCHCGHQDVVDYLKRLGIEHPPRAGNFRADLNKRRRIP